MLEDRVLFLDDNQLCALENCESLRDDGYEVSEAHTIAEAISVIDRHEPLWAMVTDIDLGPGQDGFHAARYARQAYPNLEVIYISGRSGARHALEGVAGSSFVGKPFQPWEIRQALNRAREQRLSDSPQTSFR